ncbi:MAG: hypothetical protein ABI591_31695 [Kofleriaceae bacterium]
MSAIRLGSVLVVLALAAPGGAGTVLRHGAGLRHGVGHGCSSPRVDPKTGDVVAESEKQAVKDAPHGCVPAGGPKPDVPTQPTPAPEPEKPAVVAKPSEPPHRDQPIGDKPAADKPTDPSGKNDTASSDPKPTDKPLV